MGLTKEYLVDLRDKAMAKRQEYVNMIHQANGAIDMLDMLIAQVSNSDTENQDAPNSNSHN